MKLHVVFLICASLIMSTCVFSAEAESSQLLVEYKPITIDDLLVDINSLQGEKIQVMATGVSIVGSFVITSDARSINAIPVSIEKVQREVRKYFITNCTNVKTGCQVTVYGTVGPVSYQNGIVADYIKINQ